jgi:hypothetical protein
MGDARQFLPVVVFIQTIGEVTSFIRVVPTKQFVQIIERFWAVFPDLIGQCIEYRPRFAFSYLIS